MNYVPEQRHQYDDEISLVDIAAILIRQRRIFYMVFLLFTLSGLAYALLTKESYQYTSLIQVAEKSSLKFLEEPATTIATLESRWLPEQEAEFRTANGKKLPFTVSFTNPEDTGLIRLVSEATAEAQSEVKRIHKNLLDVVKRRQDELMEREKNAVETQLNSIKRAIETLQGGEDTGIAIAEAFERKVGLERDLDALAAGEVLIVSRQSADKTGPARTMIVTVSAVGGVIIGVLLALFSHFALLVRLKMREGEME